MTMPSLKDGTLERLLQTIGTHCVLVNGHFVGATANASATIALADTNRASEN